MENPNRMLRRASNLLTSNGQPVKELDVDVDSDMPRLPGSPPLRRHKLGLGASIKRRLQEVVGGSTARSRSVGGLGRSPRTPAPSTDRGNGEIGRSHARSLSDIPIAVTPLFDDAKDDSTISTAQAPAFSDKRRSAGSQLSSVPEVSILSGVQEVTSPLQEQQPTASTSAPQLKDEGQEVKSPVQATASSSAPQLKDVLVPQLLQQGTPMTKVSAKKHKKFVFRLDADLGQIVWESVSKQQKIIPIENIKEIRTGSDARYYRQQFQLAQEYEDRWLTIVYILDGAYKTLHLIVATKDVFQIWNKTLRELHAIRQELMRGIGNIEVREALWEKQHWKGAGEERDEKLTFEEVVRLCRRLNIHSNQEDLFRLFTRADTQQRGFLDFDDFRRFVKLLKGRPEIDRLYKKLKVDSGGVFVFATFEKFMRDKQKSTLSQDELQVVFDRYTKNTDSATTMSVDSFTSFLLSPDNCAFSDQHSKVFHDMTRPLSEYFISSSHNTYLVGHQLIGDSTIEGYIRALLHSCRSVELDIFDGDHEPVIFHGKTLTTKVSLREVCQVIKKYGFVASPYPIILSAEVHCSVAQQDMIAAIMIEVFEDTLIQQPLEELAEGRRIEVLPSPEQLKGKILLKTKNLLLQGPDPVVGGDVFLSDVSASSTSDSEAWVDVTQDPSAVFNGRKRRSESDSVKDQLLKARSTVLKRVQSVGKASSSSASSSTTPRRARSPAPSSPHLSVIPVSPTSIETSLKPPITSSARRPSDASELSRQKPKMSPALVALLVYTVGVKCRGINKKEEYAPVHMFSLSENAANKMLKFGMMDLVKHTRTHMVRIYPKGTRVSSTNYEPHRFWCAGAQLVAMNWQTFDLGYMINHAMFQRNGRSGFVLKPLALRIGSKDLLSKRTQHRFDVTIISAQQLPRPKNASGHEIMDKSIIDPYVQVTVHVPDWPWVVPNHGSARKPTPGELASPSQMTAGAGGLGSPSTPRRTISCRTNVVKNNGFNPVWEEKLRIPFECVGDMMDLVFVRFVVRRQEDKDQEEPLAVYCAPLGSLEHGYRHLPLHDSQLSQYLFSTLFVKINVTLVEV